MRPRCRILQPFLLTLYSSCLVCFYVLLSFCSVITTIFLTVKWSSHHFLNVCPSNDTLDKNKKISMLVLGLHSKDRKSTKDKANIRYPKVNRGCPPLTANHTSAGCVQISLGPQCNIFNWGSTVLGVSTLCAASSKSNVHISVTKWGIVGYGLVYCWICEIGLLYIIRLCLIRNIVWVLTGSVIT